MKYANTLVINGVESVATVLPLSMVPLFDPENPPQPNTYGVPDEVEVGWVKNAQGGFEAPLVQPAPIPAEVTVFQGCAALQQAGILDEVEAYFAATTDPFEKLVWQKMTAFRRDSPLMANVGAMFGLTDAQIDDLFRFAATINT